MNDLAPALESLRASAALTGGLVGPRATNIKWPGFTRRSAAQELYQVPGAGAMMVRIQGGDTLIVRDPEGGQACEMVAFGDDGRSAPGALGEAGEGPPSGLLALFENGDESAQRMRVRASEMGLDLAGAAVIRPLANQSDPGASAQFVLQESVTMIIAAPGAAMDPHGGIPPTDLHVEIHRAQPLNSAQVPLPDPLAEPRLDLRIDRMTAAAYQVKAGEFIQLIDVAGQQCSDLLAFDQRDLDQGIESGIDPTITRTLMGNAYPKPGLFSKVFDPKMRPLVEVVRDTVGRHDSFNLACAAKYYDDMGYPGHPNCTDNFNEALADHGVQARAGWPAINFFYNTQLDDQFNIYFENPWSRPGDYVLMRAMTDLTCASSSCACDIDAANGWNPTDIHVRVYSAEKAFSKAVAYRMTADSEPKLTKETGFHPRSSELTRDFVEYKGYWLANTYRDHGAIAEYWACRERVAVIDLSALRKFEVTGPDAEQLLQHTLTRNVRRLSDGQVSYSAMCHETGGMLDDGTVLRLGPDNFRWVCGDEYGGEWLRKVAHDLGLVAMVKNSTDQLHNISVQGPASRATLAEIIWTPPARPTVDELGWFRFTVGRIGGDRGIPVVVSRTGYTGELGYEVWCHPTKAPDVWDAVFQAGAPHGIAPMGLAALDMLRIEAGLVFADAEFCDQTDPFEAGIGFSVALKTKEDDFIGRAALERRKANPVRRLVGLELDGNEVANAGDSVHIGRPQIGQVTSTTRSPILKKSIALCHMDITHAEIGTEVEIGMLDGRQKRIPAKVVPFPFYDPEKTRVRGLA